MQFLMDAVRIGMKTEYIAKLRGSSTTVKESCQLRFGSQMDFGFSLVENRAQLRTVLRLIRTSTSGLH